VRAEFSAVVTDTHPLVWYATGKTRKLSATARRLFSKVEAGSCSLHVPAPVLLELWFLSQNGTIQATPSFRRWWSSVQTPSIVEVPLEHDDILAASALTTGHRDVFDRLLVVVSNRLDLPLLTADETIREMNACEVVW
jgi:PIN domain nuclease of toxin-antitoxin system